MSLCHPGAMTNENEPQQDDELLEEPDIVGEAPPVDEYRLSTRPGVVSRPGWEP